ncbi:MAG: GTPase domain-containing protein [Candidatus Hodarchaeales archaeon]|jgi:small GTP-binding protein
MNLSSFIKKRRKLKKILFLGSGAVGKTTLLNVLKSDTLLSESTANKEYQRTLFFTFETIEAANLANLDTDGKFQLYDLAGQLDLPIHATRDIAETVLGSVDLIVFIFSTDSLQSLFDIEQWLKIIDEFNLRANRDLSSASFILVKNKADMESSINEAIIESILDYDKRFLKYFQVSCLTGQNLKEFKKWLVDYCFIGECEDD